MLFVNSWKSHVFVSTHLPLHWPTAFPCFAKLHFLTWKNDELVIVLVLLMSISIPTISPMFFASLPLLHKAKGYLMFFTASATSENPNHLFVYNLLLNSFTKQEYIISCSLLPPPWSWIMLDAGLMLKKYRECL